MPLRDEQALSTDFKVLRDTGFDLSKWLGRNPLTGLDSPSEFHQSTPQPVAIHLVQALLESFLLLLPRFLPLQRIANDKEPLSSDGSQTTGHVSSSGFCTLSTLCSPPDLPSLFHLGPVLGVLPSRLLSARVAVRRLRRRFPHGVPFASRSRRSPLQGFNTTRAARPRQPGIS